MFRVIVNNKMFDLQVVLLMCWINYVEWATPEHGKNFVNRGVATLSSAGQFGSTRTASSA